MGDLPESSFCSLLVVWHFGGLLVSPNVSSSLYKMSGCVASNFSLIPIPVLTSWFVVRQGNKVWGFYFVFLGLDFPIWNWAAQLEGSVLENNSKVAGGHPDLGYSIWLEFVYLAPSISVYLKFGSLNQAQKRHLSLLTRVQWEGKGHAEVAESAASSPASEGMTQNTQRHRKDW